LTVDVAVWSVSHKMVADVEATGHAAKPLTLGPF
jgi:hypothetical protein